MPPTSDRYAPLDEAARVAAGEAPRSESQQAQALGTEQTAQQHDTRATEASADREQQLREAKRSAETQAAFSHGSDFSQWSAAQGMIRDHQELREAAKNEQPAEMEQPRKLGFFEDHTSLKREHAEAPGKETKDADQEQKQGQGDGRSLTYYEDRNPTDPLEH